MSIEEARQLRSYFAKREQQLLEEIDALNKSINVPAPSASKKNNEVVVSNVAPAKQSSKPKTVLVSESQRAILMAIADSSNAKENNIQKMMDLKKVEFEYDIHVLSERGLITRHRSNEGIVLNLTQNGRAVVLERE